MPLKHEVSISHCGCHIDNFGTGFGWGFGGVAAGAPDPWVGNLKDIRPKMRCPKIRCPKIRCPKKSCPKRGNDAQSGARKGPQSGARIRCPKMKTLKFARYVSGNTIHTNGVPENKNLIKNKCHRPTERESPRFWSLIGSRGSSATGQGISQSPTTPKRGAKLLISKPLAKAFDSAGSSHMKPSHSMSSSTSLWS